MSTPARPFLDENNKLLAGTPALMDTGVISLPAGAGTVGILTFRTASTTMSLILTASDLDAWAGIIRDLAATVREAPVLARPNVAETIAIVQGNGKPPVR